MKYITDEDLAKKKMVFFTHLKVTPPISSNSGWFYGLVDHQQLAYQTHNGEPNHLWLRGGSFGGCLNSHDHVGSLPSSSLLFCAGIESHGRLALFDHLCVWVKHVGKPYRLLTSGCIPKVE